MVRTMKFLYCFFLLMLAACGGPLDPAYTFLAGENVGGDSRMLKTSYSGTNADTTTQEFTTARTEAQWDALWKRLQEPMPGRLPKGKMAVVVMAGQRLTGGYKVEIVTAERERRLGDTDKFNVEWREYVPAPGTMQTQTLTSPWALRLVDDWPYAPDYHELSTLSIETVSSGMNNAAGNGGANTSTDVGQSSGGSLAGGSSTGN